MSKLKVKFKKLHPDAVLPSYAKPGDAGLDLTVTETEQFKTDYADRMLRVKFGLSCEIPFGYVGRLYPRSSVYKAGAMLSNCVGVVDSGYRGEITAIFYALKDEESYKKGERAAQLIIEPIPTVEPEWAEELSETERGSGGYGSSGQ